MNSRVEKILPGDDFVREHRAIKTKGMLVVFCGIDGSGKTTLINAIQQEFEHLGISSVIFTNHAGSASPYWQSIMLSWKQLEAANLSMSEDADRTLQTAEFLAYARHVLPNLLSQYSVVLSDGYDISKIVYAKVKLNGKVGTAENLLKLATDITQPDILLYLDVSPETAMLRVRSRSKRREWNENLDVMRQAINYFQFFISQRSYSRKVDAEKPLDKVKEEAVRIIRSELNF
ncbi:MULTISPECIES: dTMP kinase [unclassified Microcoleus]|uniref:dTMP kinase n=1 Tax=unclassified Microcoleus TaxID=2642155 RepID=UPI002FCF8539